MQSSHTHWKRGRGRLGMLQPLLGSWKATAASPMGEIVCYRTFTRVLGNGFIQLDARWELPGKVYEERALVGVDGEEVCFWSFTSDGKHSTGRLCDVSDVHAEGFGFVAQMPAGTARMIYWPRDDGFGWAVESQTKKGWNRFTEHHYIRV